MPAWMINPLSALYGIVKENAGAFAFLVGAYFSWRGLKIWRDQMTGQDRYTVAKNLLRTIYHVRERVGYLRQPMYMGGEIESSLKKHFPDFKYDFFNHTEEDDKKVDRAVLFERWSEVRQVLVDYRVIKFEALVHWGDPIAKAFADFEKVVNGLKIRVDMLPRIDKDARDGSREKVEQYIFDIGDDSPDEFKTEFYRTIAEIESIVRPALK